MAVINQLAPTYGCELPLVCGAPVPVGPLGRRGGVPQPARAPVRTDPANLNEQMMLREARSGLGRETMQGRIRDPKFPQAEWAKMEHIRTMNDGTRIEIHYWRHRATGEVLDPKFKNVPWELAKPTPPSS